MRELVVFEPDSTRVGYLDRGSMRDDGYGTGGDCPCGNDRMTSCSSSTTAITMTILYSHDLHIMIFMVWLLSHIKKINCSLSIWLVSSARRRGHRRGLIFFLFVASHTVVHCLWFDVGVV